MARTFIAALLASLVLTATARAADSPARPARSTPDGTRKYLLQYKFAPNEVIRTKVVHQAAVKTTIEGTSQTAQTVSISVKRWDVKDVDAQGQVTFVHSVEYVDMKNDITGRDTVRFDSRTGDEPPPGFEDVAKRVGVPLTVVVMDPTGKITSREDKASGPTTITQLTMPLPAEPVAVGHVWTFPYEIDVPLRSGRTKKIKMRQRFELLDVEDNLATINVATQVLSPVSEPEIQAQLVQRQSEGEIRFNIMAGRVVGQQIDLDRRVTGYPNAKSTMRYRTRFTETLLDAEENTAKRPGTTRQ
jgi:hypothetical protein